MSTQHQAGEFLNSTAVQQELLTEAVVQRTQTVSPAVEIARRVLALQIDGTELTQADPYTTNNGSQFESSYYSRQQVV